MTTTYTEYLKSPEWRKRADAALYRADYRCQICNSRYSLQVHHRTYEDLGNEDPIDLTVLCNKCHRLFSKRLALYDAATVDAKRRTRLRKKRREQV